MELDELDNMMAVEMGESGRTGNGFVDPRELYQLDDADQMDGSTDEKSEPDRSQSSSPPIPRKFWKPTGCCYDDRMKLHANAEFSVKPAHPEDPRRIEAIMKEFKEAGLIYHGPDSNLREVLESSPTCWMYRISAREATKEEICLVHLGSHYDWVQSLSTKSSAELREMTAVLDQGRRSLYVGNLTYEASLISAGGAIETCKNVVAGNVKNAIAIIRPPGHHAEHNESMGFCLFNNVSIAAKVCQADYPEVCRKILILDWDVHHGNGIQNIFYEDPNVLYISLHVYNNGEFYPGASDEKGIPDGDLDKCGFGAGIGKNVNIGWHDQGMGDGEYMAAFQRIVMPIAQEFDPDLVIVAAGFDAASGDELGGCYVTPACYAHMTHMLMSLADGKIAVCLEGGYNLRAISRSALAVAKTLMGEPPERITIPPINFQAAGVLDQVKEFQAPYWECMRRGPKTIVNPREAAREIRDYGATSLNNVIRGYQQKMLSANYRMISLYIHREKLTRDFKNQVLATQNLRLAKKILLIIHDPPELLAIPDPVEQRTETQNAWIADGVTPYIDWAVLNGFGVIDVTVPLNSPEHEKNGVGFVAHVDDNQIHLKMAELVCYIWDNYLEGYESTDIVLMGVGFSYIAVRMLLTSRDCKFKIRAVLNFVSGDLRTVRSDTDQSLAQWYKANSRIYVAGNHACWQDPDYAQRVRKNRFGRVEKSDEVTLNRMLAAHKPEATAWLAESISSDMTEA